MGKTEKIILSEAQEAWLVKHFKHTKNEAIAKRLNVSVRSVNRLAEKRGLTKTKQFMKKCQLESAAKANESNRRNGTYPPKGYKVPNRELTQFQKGVKPIERLGAKKEAQRVAKCVESRKKTFGLERARALYGLPRKTKLNVVKRLKKQIMLRYYLKKCGYVVERGGFTFYYSNDTKRSLQIESRPLTGFKFLPL